MMVGQGKVAGHSQTDSKHRRGFSKIKALQNKLARTNGETSLQSSIETGEKRYIQKDNHWEKRLKILASIFIMLFIGTLVFTLKEDGGKHFYTKSAKEIYTVAEYNFTKAELIDAYNTNVLEGKGFLNLQSYKEAEPYFQRALSFNNDGVEANLGLLKVACYRCYLEVVNCEGAKEYLDKAKVNDWLSESDLEHLEQLIQ
jgi:tetratricopeptide (TPR) repeat protein